MLVVEVAPDDRVMRDGVSVCGESRTFMVVIGCRCVLLGLCVLDRIYLGPAAVTADVIWCMAVCKHLKCACLHRYYGQGFC